MPGKSGTPQAKKKKRKRRGKRRPSVKGAGAPARRRGLVHATPPRAKRTTARRATPKRRRQRNFVHLRHAYPRAGHRVHLAFDAAVDAAPPTTDRVPVTPLDPTPHFAISYQTSLLQDGAAIAGYLRSACEFDLQRLANIFGVKWDALHFTITVLQGSAGAWHPDPCSNPNIFVGANARLPDGSPDFLFLRAMALSEIVEVLGGRFGWNCGWSNGEGISRAFGDFLVPCQRPGNFLSAKVWLDPPSTREDFVSKTFQGDEDHPGDRDYPSIGCSVLFLNWMHFQRGLPWEDIARKGAGTLAETYKALVTDGTNGFAEFNDLLIRNASTVSARASASDNVFPL